MSDKIFTEGIWFQKRDNAPSYVIGSLSIKVPDLIPFLNRHQNNAGYVNVDIKMGQSGKYYIELNTWKPTKDTAKEEVNNQENLNNMDRVEYPSEDINPEDIPF